MRYLSRTFPDHVRKTLGTLARRLLKTRQPIWRNSSQLFIASSDFSEVASCHKWETQQHRCPTCLRANPRHRTSARHRYSHRRASSTEVSSSRTCAAVWIQYVNFPPLTTSMWTKSEQFTTALLCCKTSCRNASHLASTSSTSCRTMSASKTDSTSSGSTSVAHPFPYFEGRLGRLVGHQCCHAISQPCGRSTGRRQPRNDFVRSSGRRRLAAMTHGGG